MIAARREVALLTGRKNDRRGNTAVRVVGVPEGSYDEVSHPDGCADRPTHPGRSSLSFRCRRRTMPLSEHEQRLLDQIERALYAEDPKFASTVRGGPLRRTPPRRRVQGIGLVVLRVG